MNINEFNEKYGSFINEDYININCEHSKHLGDSNINIKKGAAKKNILRNKQREKGEVFICRECYMAYNNPMTNRGTRLQSDETIKTSCPQCGKIREIKKSAYFGELKEPYYQICGSCVQEGKEISESQREKTREKLKGRALSEEHKYNISNYMKTNEEGIERGKQNLKAGYGAGWNKGQETPQEVRDKISEANKGKIRTEEQRRNISEGRKKMLEETGGFTDEHKRKISEATIRQYQNGFNPQLHHITGWHQSSKAGRIFYKSSYEKKAYLKLDDDNTVATYRPETIIVEYYNPEKSGICNYLVDIEVFYKDGTEKWLEIKPAKWLQDSVVKAKIEAGLKKSQAENKKFEVWTELKLFGAVYNEKHIRQFAEKLKIENGEIVLSEEERKESNRKRAKNHYDNKIATEKIKIDCDYCQKEHEILKISYDKNVAKNGRYICIKENGAINGKKPKLSLIKENPYAADGKKQCKKCQEVLDFNSFGLDKSRRDGYADKCKQCRRK